MSSCCPFLLKLHLVIKKGATTREILWILQMISCRRFTVLGRKMYPVRGMGKIDGQKTTEDREGKTHGTPTGEGRFSHLREGLHSASLTNYQF